MVGGKTVPAVAVKRMEEGAASERVDSRGIRYSFVLVLGKELNQLACFCTGRENEKVMHLFHKLQRSYSPHITAAETLRNRFTEKEWLSGCIEDVHQFRTGLQAVPEMHDDEMVLRPPLNVFTDFQIGCVRFGEVQCAITTGQGFLRRVSDPFGIEGREYRITIRCCSQEEKRLLTAADERFGGPNPFCRISDDAYRSVWRHPRVLEELKRGTVAKVDGRMISGISKI